MPDILSRSCSHGLVDVAVDHPKVQYVPAARIREVDLAYAWHLRVSAVRCLLFYNSKPEELKSQKSTTVRLRVDVQHKSTLLTMLFKVVKSSCFQSQCVLPGCIIVNRSKHAEVSVSPTSARQRVNVLSPFCLRTRLNVASTSVPEWSITRCPTATGLDTTACHLSNLRPGVATPSYAGPCTLLRALHFLTCHRCQATLVRFENTKRTSHMFFSYLPLPQNAKTTTRRGMSSSHCRLYRGTRPCM